MITWLKRRFVLWLLKEYAQDEVPEQPKQPVEEMVRYFVSYTVAWPHPYPNSPLKLMPSMSVIDMHGEIDCAMKVQGCSEYLRQQASLKVGIELPANSVMITNIQPIARWPKPQQQPEACPSNN